MSRDEAARQPSHSVSVKVFDQLRQGGWPNAHRPGAATYRRHGASVTPLQDVGILGQLRTERAHD